MARKRVDMSEAYDYLREKSGSFVLCFDIQNLVPINEISFKASDLAILECASRINDAAGDDMLMLRIGGDEFALVTGLYEREQAKALSEQVLKKNGEPILFEGQAIPLSLYCGMTTIPKSLRVLRRNAQGDTGQQAIIQSNVKPPLYQRRFLFIFHTGINWNDHYSAHDNNWAEIM